MSVKQRLIEFIKKEEISIHAFEKSAGISNGYIKNLSKQPREGVLKKILLTYPQLNRVWLLTGEGNMLNSSDVSPVADMELKPYTVNSHGIKFLERQDGQLLMEVPVVPFDALGSPECELSELVASREEGETVTFETDMVHHGMYMAFAVDNDSMDDGSRHSFAKGDIVLVRELPRDDWAPRLLIDKWPYWVVCWRNCIRIKQIVAQDIEAGTITLHSLNPSPEYTDFTLSLSDVSRLFNVIQLRPKPLTF